MVIDLTAMSSQDVTLEYAIIRKGDQIGHMVVTKNTWHNETSIQLVTDISTRIIFSITAGGREEAVFENGIMIRSFLYRQFNGREKVNKRTREDGHKYLIQTSSSSESFTEFPINYSLLSLYILEPKNITRAYSDNFEQFVDIQKLGTGHYRVRFPDRNYSEFFYQDGVCDRVEIHHTLYSVTMELRP